MVKSATLAEICCIQTSGERVHLDNVEAWCRICINPTALIPHIAEARDAVKKTISLSRRRRTWSTRFRVGTVVNAKPTDSGIVDS